MNCKPIAPTLDIELQIITRKPNPPKQSKPHACAGNCRNCPNNRARLK